MTMSDGDDIVPGLELWDCAMNWGTYDGEAPFAAGRLECASKVKEAMISGATPTPYMQVSQDTFNSDVILRVAHAHRLVYNELDEMVAQ